MVDTNNVVSLPDREAQRLWQEVAWTSDEIADLVSEIPASSVAGENTRLELSGALGLLEQAKNLLELTKRREGPRYREVAP